MYKKAAEFWAELRVELLAASAILNDDRPNSSQLWRLYWASHQVEDLEGLLGLVNFHTCGRRMGDKEICFAILME